MEGDIELSLGCLKYAINRRERDRLQFPFMLQVLESTTCWAKRSQYGTQKLSHIISVSDGFYKRTDCFIVDADAKIEPYSIISVSNIDFDVCIERGRDRVKIIGQILEHEIKVAGSTIGYFSGNPISLDQFQRGAMEIRNLLSDKLWRQVQQAKCCDVTFKFTALPGEPVVLAQKSALIAHSDVFEAQFEGGYLENNGVVQITDTEPRYMRSLVQYVFTQFVPLLSTLQAFEVLYLANKYMIKDLEKFCRNFIINTKTRKNSPKDIFKYMELNVKCCDDEIATFVLQEFARHTNAFIRQPGFLELSLSAVEMFLSQPNLNAHEWELLQAIRRWAKHKGVNTACTIESSECLHQILECVLWRSVPLKEAIIVNSWPELGFDRDTEFLTRISESNRRLPIEIDRVVPTILNRGYSLNRRYSTSKNFVIYTNLALDLVREEVECLNGYPVGPHTRESTHCSSVGPPFEIQGATVVPSYGVEKVNPRNNPADIKLRIDLSYDHQGHDLKKSNARSTFVTVLETAVSVKLFSFSTNQSGKEKEFHLKFTHDGYSHCTFEMLIMRDQLPNYQYNWDGKTQIDLQMRFYEADCINSRHKTTVRSQKLTRSRGRSRIKSRDDGRHNYMSGVGPVLRRLRGSPDRDIVYPSPRYHTYQDRMTEDRMNRSTSTEDVILVETPIREYSDSDQESRAWSPISPFTQSPRSPRSPRLVMRSPTPDSDHSVYSPSRQSPEYAPNHGTPPAYESEDERRLGQWGDASHNLSTSPIAESAGSPPSPVSISSASTPRYRTPSPQPGPSGHGNNRHKRWLNAQITPPAGSGRNSSPDYNPPSVAESEHAYSPSSRRFGAYSPDRLSPKYNPQMSPKYRPDSRSSGPSPHSNAESGPETSEREEDEAENEHEENGKY